MSDTSIVDSAAFVGIAAAVTVAGLGIAYHMATRTQTSALPTVTVPMDSQSLELPDGSRISRYCKNEKLIEYTFEDAKTLYEAFIRGKKVSDNGNCLGWRETKDSPYTWLTYSQVEERFMNFGAGLVHIGISPGQDSFIGVYGRNCVEWTVAELSSHAYSRVVIGLYDTLGKESMTHIINQTEISCVVCSNANISKLAEQVSECPVLKHIVVMGSTVSDDDKRLAEEAGLKIYTFTEIEELGKANPVDPVLPTPDSITTICYTSGTTGLPKGAIVTHGNVIADMSGLQAHLQETFLFTPSDVHLSYLPLSHILEKCTQTMLFMNGAQIGFFSGDVKSLVNDVQTLQPTMFLAVPRVLNRIYDKVMNGVQSSNWIKKWLFNTAFQSKLSEVKNGVVRRDSIWDRIVFGRLQKLLGGNVRAIVSGAAPINAQVLDFFCVTMGCFVIEGYGQTECTAGATMTLPNDTGSGYVGPPLPCCKIKVVDVPDLNYYASNGEGEICFWGPNCIKSYYKDTEKTRQLIDEDGWIHSGDVGKWLPNGALKVIDRVKHIFKLSQGEYVAPEKVENVCLRSSFIAQMFLYGDGLRSCCVAIVVPDEEVLMKWASDNGRKDDTFENLCLDGGIRQMIFDDLQTVARRDGLNSLEIPKAIKLSSTQFSVDNGIITPTFKIKRPFAKAHFISDIDEMYSQLQN